MLLQKASSSILSFHITGPVFHNNLLHCRSTSLGRRVWNRKQLSLTPWGLSDLLRYAQLCFNIDWYKTTSTSMNESMLPSQPWRTYSFLATNLLDKCMNRWLGYGSSYGASSVPNPCCNPQDKLGPNVSSIIAVNDFLTAAIAGLAGAKTYFFSGLMSKDQVSTFVFCASIWDNIVMTYHD